MVASRQTSRVFILSGQVWYEFTNPEGWKIWFSRVEIRTKDMTFGARDSLRLFRLRYPAPMNIQRRLIA